MDSAKEEFRTLGFEKASLKSICQRAGVTTGALYKRYAGKEELFRAVVADTVADLDAVYEERTAVPASALSDEDLIRAWYMDENICCGGFRFLNERRDGFVLLLTGAEGTAYANFQHDWVEKMTEGTWTYYAEARRRGLCTVDMTREELHVVLSAFWTTIYEPFIHDFTWRRSSATALWSAVSLTGTLPWDSPRGEKRLCGGLFLANKLAITN